MNLIIILSIVIAVAALYQARRFYIKLKEISREKERISNELHLRIKTILHQKNEQDAVLTTMDEGVVALDEFQRISHMNRAAAQILGVSRGSSQGRPVVEVIRIPEVLQLIEESLTSGQKGERDIELPEGSVRYLRVRSSPLTNVEEGHHGLLLVLSDVTRIRELEGMRRNFVANVSHELRTPLTSIQGFAETVLNPQVKDPEEIKKFVSIIQRHSMRLSRIIEDILTLSRVEKDAESGQIELKKELLKPILEEAVELCSVKANMKQIALTLTCEPNLTAMIDKYLLEQAVVNLIDNAIRYSDPGDPVRVEGLAVNEGVEIRVIDQGIGIAEKHLPRIFERFYRVDKARARELGGTGLGLSIVKHITIAHRGRLHVKSEPGEGSTFSIILPQFSPQSNN